MQGREKERERRKYPEVHISHQDVGEFQDENVL